LGFEPNLEGVFVAIVSAFTVAVRRSAPCLVRVQVWDIHAGAPLFRRIQVKCDQATRDGDRMLYLLTNVPLRKASAKRIARLNRTRWTLERAFQHLEASCHAELNTLAYPKAAMFGFCLVLVASNMVAVSWRRCAAPRSCALTRNCPSKDNARGGL
jgi:hypothetical protein